MPTTLLPFQPYERLSEVFGSADVLVVLLEKSAGAFSVPSKTLSYLCAGRPVIGLMPAENLASQLLRDAECAVFSPESESVDEAAKWVVEVVNDASVQTALTRPPADWPSTSSPARSAPTSSSDEAGHGPDAD